MIVYNGNLYGIADLIQKVSVMSHCFTVAPLPCKAKSPLSIDPNAVGTKQIAL